jgi:CheY-like chemotaxis protein
MPLRVLIAADDAWVRVMLADALVAVGCSVEQVSNGLSALRRATATLPDIALLSPRLPELDAEDVRRALRSAVRTRHIAVVVIDPLAMLAAPVEALVDVRAAPVEALVGVRAAPMLARRDRCPAQAGAAAPTRSVSASRDTWLSLPGAAVGSRGTSRMRKAGRSGKWRFRSGIDTL